MVGSGASFLLLESLWAEQDAKNGGNEREERKIKRGRDTEVGRGPHSWLKNGVGFV